MDITIPDDIAKTTDLSEDELDEIIAVSLYKLNKISGVQGGKIIGKYEIEFHALLEKYGQTINYDTNDLIKDIDNLKDF